MDDMLHIDEGKELSSADTVILYWFQNLGECDENSDEYKSFLPDQSLIKDFNKFGKTWHDKYKSKPEINKTINLDIDLPKNEYYLEQLKVGHVFESYIYGLFKNEGIDINHFFDKRQNFTENDKNIEIKRDQRAKETKNLYIEVTERKDEESEWSKASLLLNTDCKYWIIGDIDDYYVLDANKLRELYKNRHTNGLKVVSNTKKDTSKAFILPIKQAINEKICLSQSIKEFCNLYLKK